MAKAGCAAIGATTGKSWQTGVETAALPLLNRLELEPKKYWSS